MHILIITPGQFMTSKLPTANLFQHHQAEALHNAGHQVAILSCAFVPARYMFQTYPYRKIDMNFGFPICRSYHRQVIPTKFKFTSWAVLNYRKIGLKFYYKYQERYGKPEVIHAHNFQYGGIIAQEISRVTGIPYMLTEHSSWHSRGLFTEAEYASFKSCMSEASYITAVSQQFSSLLSRKLDNPNVYTLPNIIDPFFEKNELSLTQKNNVFTFLNIASLDEKKDHYTLLNAFSEFFKGKPIKLVIVGTGKLRGRLEGMCFQLGIQNQVQFLGLVDRIAVKSLMSESHCFVLSSKYETFGVVLIEALSCGLPVVATKCGGPEDIVNNANGILVEISNTQKLGRAMLKVYANRNMYIGSEIRKNVLKEFGSKTFVNRVTKLYKKIL